VTCVKVPISKGKTHKRCCNHF